MDAMHLVKVALLLILTVAVMRAVSWGVGWLIDFVRKKTDRWSAVAANGLSLILFGGLVFGTLAPGESFDYEAFGFGAGVYALCLAMDLKWWPWNRRPA